MGFLLSNHVSWSKHPDSSNSLLPHTLPNAYLYITLICKVRKTQHHNPEFGHTQGEIQKKPEKKYISNSMGDSTQKTIKKYISIQQGMKLRKPLKKFISINRGGNSENHHFQG
jgi:hypothetical protein